MGNATKNARALMGFMDEQEALNFLKGSCVLEDASDEKLGVLWRSAKSAVDVATPPDLVPEILDIEERHRPHLETVARDPVFPEAVGKLKWSFKLVEIDKLVCFQKYVDTDYSERLAAGKDLADIATLLEFCLPLKPTPRRVGTSHDPTQNAYTLSSSTLDFRVVGAFQSHDAVTKRRIYGFATGFGVPFIQVAHFRDRYVLKNGYHRAFVVRSAGVHHVPCILVEAESLADAGGGRPGFFQEPLLMSRNPPTFSSFLVDAIAPPLKVHALTKVVRIRAEEFVLPGVVQPQAMPELREKPSMPPSPVSIERGEGITIEREGWNVYRLEDGTILKVSQLLMNLGASFGPGLAPLERSMELTNVFVALSVPTGLRGPPSRQQYSPTDLASAVVQRNLRFVKTRETANEYVTASGERFELSLVLADVSRTNKFDATGNPIYLVNTQVSIQQVVPVGD